MNDALLARFNLVIEMLFISGQPHTLHKRMHNRFNLVIEMLFISGYPVPLPQHERNVSIS